MKTRLNLTIEKNLLEKVKNYATSKKSSVSELVENYFKTFVQVPSQRRISDIIEELPKPEIPMRGDLKKQYLEQNADKYGF